MKEKLKKNIGRIIVLGIAIVLLIASFIIRTSTTLCEKITRTLTRAWLYIFGHASSIFPFSVSEVFIIIAILLLISIIVYAIVCAKKPKNKTLYFIIDYILTAAMIFSVYSFVAMPAYNREELDIPVYKEEISNEDILEMGKYYLNLMSEYGEKIKKNTNNQANMESYFTFDQLNSLLTDEYKKLDSDYFAPYTPKEKKILNSWFMTECGITGFEFILTGEGSINVAMPDIDIPFTMAHEMAHTKGIMREDECNMMGYYICLNSDNDFIKYSGLFRIYSQVMNSIYYTRSYTEYCDFYNTYVPQTMIDENKEYFKYWDEHNSLDKIQDFINDVYLKFNGMIKGIDSYQDSSENTDTGEKYDDGSKVYEVEFSRTQRMLYQLYINAK